MSIFLCFSFLLLPFAGCSDSDNGTGESSGGDGVSLEDIRVIPLPQFISYGRGAFAVDKDVTISCTAAIEDEATLLPAPPFADQQRLSKHESRCCKPCVSIAEIRQFLHFVWFSKL